MKNSNLFGVSMPSPTAWDLHVFTARPAHAPHAAHAAGSAAVGIAAQRKRRTAAPTEASVDGGIA